VTTSEYLLLIVFAFLDSESAELYFKIIFMQVRGQVKEQSNVVFDLNRLI